MQIVFSFDTEDYIDPVSNDALLELARIHTRHGVPATFGLVGEKARFIHACGREDVIAALADHEVGYHSDHHFILPNWRYPHRHMPDHVLSNDWDIGMDRLLAEESRGLADIEAIFGTRPVTQLRNYGDWTPQVMCCHAQLGVPVHAYGPVFHNQDPQVIWYCNQLQVANPRHTYEENLHDTGITAEEKLAAHKASVIKHLEAGTERLGWVTHPTRFIADHWWEEPNWWGHSRDPHRRDWRAPERFTTRQTEELLWIADGLVEFVAGLADVEPLTFRDFAQAHRQTRTFVTREEIGLLAAQVSGRPAMLELDGEWLSPAELFGLFAHALGAPEEGAAGDRSPLRHIIGPTDEPIETTAGEVKREELLAACREVEFFVRDFARVPAKVKIGEAEVGPGSFLLAMAQALREPETLRITIPRADNLPEPLRPEDYLTIGSGGSPMGYIQYQGRREELDYSSIQRHAQLQYWTVKRAGIGD